MPQKPPQPARAPLVERDLRRADFLESCSVPVVLADGQEWFVPKPQIWFRPTGDALGYATEPVTGDGDFDDSFGRAWAAYQKAQDERGNVIGAMFGVFRTMLLRNYSLSDEQLGRILRLKLFEDDPVREALIRIAQGLDAPKPSSDGDGLA
jgi:hypothetical protein